MISNMESQLKAQGAAHRIKEVLEEVPRVRADAGYPPLVTPSSQIVGTQAVFNVMMGRYKVLTGEFADVMLGYYGSTLGTPNPEVVEIARAQAKKDPITCRPADLLPAEWEKDREEAGALRGFNGSDEDVLTYAMFPKVAPTFFGTRDEGPKNVGKDPDTLAAEKAATEAGAQPGQPVRTPIRYKVIVNGAPHSVQVQPS
jgi:methylmalonyl-CoA carboxyltransferase 5S subunit